VHQIDEFNIKKHNIFLHGSIPPNPRDRCVLPKVPAFPKNPVGKIGIAIQMQLVIVECIVFTYYMALVVLIGVGIHIQGRAKVCLCF